MAEDDRAAYARDATAALALGAGDPALRDHVRRYLDSHAELAALQI